MECTEIFLDDYKEAKFKLYLFLENYDLLRRFTCNHKDSCSLAFSNTLLTFMKYK